MPGGAANVARNLTALQVPTELLGAVGRDPAAAQLKRLLSDYHIGCRGLLGDAAPRHQRQDAHRGPQATGRPH